VIVDGKASVSIGERVVNTLAPGDFFGEIALLDHGPRTATVIAETDLIAEVIGQREFDAVLVNAPHLAKKVLVGLASRLRAADLHLVH
jgi:CRP-like cAMP-binding protein